jgi:hypothetical protein
MEGIRSKQCIRDWRSLKPRFDFAGCLFRGSYEVENQITFLNRLVEIVAGIQKPFKTIGAVVPSIGLESFAFFAPCRNAGISRW